MKRILVFLLFFPHYACAEIATADILKLWEYSDPVTSESRFRELLPSVQASGNDEILATLLTQIARSYSLRGDFVAAHKELDRSLLLLGNKDSNAMAFYMMERGRAFNSAGNKNKALPLFIAAWEITRETGYDYLAVDAAHMVAIAEELGKQMEWNMKALQLAETSASEDARDWLGSLYNNIGWTYFNLTEYSSALVMFKKGVDFRRAKGQSDRLHIALWTQAKTHRALGQLDEALKMQKDLEKKLQASGAALDGFVYEELAEIYYLQKDPKAKDYFSRAYAILSRDEWLKINESQRLQRLKTLSEVKETKE